MTFDEHLSAQTGMRYEQFLELVERMRRSENAYFKDRNKSDLIRSKELEKEVDAVVGRWRQGWMIME